MVASVARGAVSGPARGARLLEGRCWLGAEPGATAWTPADPATPCLAVAWGK